MRIAAHFSPPLALVVLALGGGCAAFEAPALDEAEARRAGTDFESWKESVRFEGRADVYAVGEHVSPLALVGDEEAWAYYERYVQPSTALTLHNGQRRPGDPWTGSYFPERAVLSFCVDRVAWDDVQRRHAYLPTEVDLFSRISHAFESAAAAWSAVTGVTMVRNASRDGSCQPKPGDDITWYVRPMPPQDPIEHFTFALRPHHNLQGPDFREVFVLEDIVVEFTLEDPAPFSAWFTLEGLMANLVGKALGFVGEANRGGVDSGLWPETCRKPDVGGVFLTLPDPMSVMTHPVAMKPVLANADCSGYRTHDYAITYLDAMGAACQYRGEHGLFYCNANPQANLAIEASEHCSPVPLFEGGPSDCGGDLPAKWDDDAADYEAALISTLN